MSKMVKFTNNTLTGVMRTLATTGEHPEVILDENDQDASGILFKNNKYIKNISHSLMKLN